MKELCTRQVCFIMAVYSAANKLLMMPALLAYHASRDLIFPALALYVLQTAVVWAVAFACSKTQKTVFQIVEDALGGIAAKALMWILAAFFLFASLMPMLEQKLFVQSAFYDTIPALITFLPFFVFSAYAAAKGLNNAGRLADIALPVFAFAMFAVFVLSVGEVNAQWLLPVLRTPASSLVSGARFALYNFTDGAVMLMLMGRFAYRRGDCTKITLSYAAGALVVLAFLFVFYGVYSVLAPDTYFAVSKVCIFFTALSMVGRADLVAVYALELCMLFSLVFYMQLSAQCVRQAVFRAQPSSAGYAMVSLALNAIMLALVIILNNNYFSVQQFFGKALWVVFAVISFILPPLVWALKYRFGGPR